MGLIIFLLRQTADPLVEPPGGPSHQPGASFDPPSGQRRLKGSTDLAVDIRVHEEVGPTEINRKRLPGRLAGCPAEQFNLRQSLYAAGQRPEGAYSVTYSP
jgi:hypothetical protein